jgi:hypothetical protein
MEGKGAARPWEKEDCFCLVKTGEKRYNKTVIRSGMDRTFVGTP